MNIEKCEVCLHSRWIISENGFHPICALSSKKAMDCMSGKKSYSVTLEKTDKEYDATKDVGRIEYEIPF